MLLREDLELHRVDDPVPVPVRPPHVQRHPVQSALARVRQQNARPLLQRALVEVEVLVAAAVVAVVVVVGDGREDGVGLVQVVAGQRGGAVTGSGR